MSFDGIAVVSNGTLTSSGSGSQISSLVGSQVNAIINVSGSVTGTNPVLVVTISELDPGNGVTVFNSVSTSNITAAGVTTITLNLKSSSVYNISWTVTGTTPSFGGVYITALNRTTSLLDKFGNPVYHSFAEAVSEGLVPGVTVNRAQGYIGTSATTQVAVRATAYTPQGANAQRSIKSTSASDTSAGIGAQTVTINYLDASMVSHSETVTLNGTTAVNTVGTNIALIENMVVATCGSNGGNVGTIQLFVNTAGGGGVWASIAVGDNQTFWAHHYVPTGVTCYILTVTAGATVTAGQCNVNRFGNPLATNLPQLQVGVTITHGGAANWDHEYQVPLAVVGPDLILLIEHPVSATASTAVAGFEYVQF